MAKKVARRAREKSASNGTGEKPSFILFGGLAVIALFKDILDFIGIGSLPVLGTAVTLGFSFLIFMLLVLFDRSGGRGNKRLAQGMVMTFFTLIEAIIPILNFLPFETLTIIFLYNISHRSWKESQKAMASSNRALTKKQKIQQAQAARAMARQAQAVTQAAAETTSLETISGAAASVQAARVPQMARPVSGVPVGQSAARQPGSFAPRSTQPAYVPGSSKSAANDAAYALGKNSADAAMMRIREAGSRLSQVPLASRPSGNRPIQQGAADMKRAA